MGSIATRRPETFPHFYHISTCGQSSVAIKNFAEKIPHLFTLILQRLTLQTRSALSDVSHIRTLQFLLSATPGNPRCRHHSSRKTSLKGIVAS